MVYDINDELKGEITEIHHYGIYLKLENGEQGYIRRSKLTLDGVYPQDQFKIGDTVTAKLIRDYPHLELDRASTLPDPWENIHLKIQEGDTVSGIITKVIPDKYIYLKIFPGVTGVIPIEDILRIFDREYLNELINNENNVSDDIKFQKDTKRTVIETMFWEQDFIEGRVKNINKQRRQVELSIADEISGRKTAYKTAAEINRSIDAKTNVPKQTPPPSDKHYEEIIKFIVSQELRICLVEDNPIQMIETTSFLDDHGISHEIAINQKKAKDCFDDNSYDLVFLDYDFDGISGLEIAKTIEVNQLGFPIIILTNKHANLPDEQLEKHNIQIAVDKRIITSDLIQILSETASAKLYEERPNLASNSFEHPALFSELFRLTTSDQENQEDIIKSVMERARKKIKADHVILFHAKQNGKYEILKEVGDLTIEQDNLHNLEDSIVKDVIFEQIAIFDEHVDKMRTHGGYRHSHLLRIVEYGGCIGYPVRIHNGVKHALFFLFNSQGSVSRKQHEESISHVFLIASLLTEETINKRLQSVGRALISADLAAATTHELQAILPKLMKLLEELIEDFHSLTDSEKYDGFMDISKRVKAIDKAITLVQSVNTIHTQVLDKTVNLYSEVLVPIRKNLFDANNEQSDGGIINDDIQFYVIWSEQVLVTQEHADRLRHILLNLILNAMDMLRINSKPKIASEYDLRYVELILRKTDTKYQIFVRDTGPGIHYSLWKDVFLPGFTNKDRGSGLGLTIAKSFMQSINGEIRIQDSNILTGTTFIVEFNIE